MMTQPTMFSFLRPLFLMTFLFAATLPLRSSDNDEGTANNVDTIKIAGAIIPGLFEPDKRGPYNEVFDLITADYPAQIDLILSPIRRAQRLFYSKQADCFYVGSNDPKVFQSRGFGADDFIFSAPIKTVSVRAYTRPEDLVITSKEQLKGKLIAIDIGANNIDFINAMYIPGNVNTIPTNSPAQALALLKQDRVEVAIAFDYDVEMLVKADPSAANFMYAGDFSLLTNGDALLCHPTAATKNLIKHVNAKLYALRATGRLQAITDN